MVCTVLVVDDDPAFRDLATRLLKNWGHQVVGEAESLAEALVRAAELRSGAAGFVPKAQLTDAALRRLIATR